MLQVVRGQPLITAETTSEYRAMLASMHLIPVDGLPTSLHVRLRLVAALCAATSARARSWSLLQCACGAVAVHQRGWMCGA